MKKIYLGTSGWIYKHWGEKFYPADLPDREKLKYFAKHFKSLEINSSFYHLPPITSFAKWYKETPKDFVFAVKLNRYLTHRKKLILDEESLPYLKAFLANCQKLKEKFKALLIQLPPSFKADHERLETFLKITTKILKRKKYKPQLAVEFRHPTWFTSTTYAILKEYDAALVIASSARFRSDPIFTADFSYVRFHGPERMFASKYSEKDLKKWYEFMQKQKKIKKWFIYFNNDFEAYAITNAESLRRKFFD